MERCFGLKDNVIIMIGATAHLITRIIFAAANQPYLFYVGMYDCLYFACKVTVDVRNKR